MTTTAAPARGRITYNPEFGHVCTCSEVITPPECEGHPAGPFDPMGETAYCDGSCSEDQVDYTPTVTVDRSTEPTESGSYLYHCTRCGANGWSGC